VRRDDDRGGWFCVDCCRFEEDADFTMADVIVTVLILFLIALACTYLAAAWWPRP
jgi:hypothetical protein